MALEDVTARPESRNRIPCLDGIRAISIFGVLLGHLMGTSGFLAQGGLITSVGDLGNFGVRVFFVVSGFLITHLLIQEHQKRGSISVKHFYIRRSFRIFPAFYCYLAVIAALALAGLVSLQWGDFGYAATYTINFVERKSWVVGHLWSLAVEEQFYLLWPAVIVLVGWKRAAGFALAAVLLAPLLRIGVWYGLPEYRGLLTKAFPTIFDTIATGCLLALYRDRLFQWESYRNFLTSPWFLLVPLAAIASNALASHTRPDFLVGQSVRNIGIALCIDWCLRNPAGRVGRFLSLAPLVWVGTLSYSLYLWQQLFLNRHSDAWWCRFPVNVALAFGFAILSYYLVERPCQRLRQRWFPGPISRTPQPGLPDFRVPAPAELRRRPADQAIHSSSLMP
jgi:peptidoglycan/LPS O-acetylase OafA/YrhL